MKPRSLSLRPVMFLVAVLLSLASQAAPQTQEALGRQATVIYQDGFAQPILHFRFVYHWLFRSEANCVNCPVRRRESQDFPYSEIRRTDADRVQGISDVTVGRIIPGEAIRRIDIVWPKVGSYFCRPERAVFELSDGSKITLANPLRCPTAEFLAGEDGEVYLSHGGGLTIEGDVVVEGRCAKFSVFAFNRGETPKDTVRTIVFDPAAR